MAYRCPVPAPFCRAGSFETAEALARHSERAHFNTPSWPARRLAKIESALKEFATAHFECGEWDRNESDETFDAVMERAETAERKLRKLLGLPEKGA